MSDIEVKGLDELFRKMKVLPSRVQKNVLVGATRASAKPIIDEARRLVPKENGNIKKSIGVVRKKSKDKNIIEFSVAPRVSKGGWYAHYIEFGTYAKLDHPMVRPRKGKLGKRRALIVAKGEGIPAHPFIRPAFEKKGNETIEVAKEYISKRLPKELEKIAKG